MNRQMKLNLGSSCPKGRYLSKEWINLDLFKFDRLNVQASLEALPFRDNSFIEINIVHVLEHLTREKPLPVLKEAQRVLAPGGALFVEVPNGEEIVYLLTYAFKTNNRPMIHKWQTSLWGKTERKGMQHHMGYHRQQLTELAAQANFRSLEIVTAEADMISGHYLQEPVILLKCLK